MMNTTANARDVPVEDAHENLLDSSHSIIWRILHGISYLLGGLFFIAGSCMYFVKVLAEYPNALLAGGWLYIVGSACFLVADLQDWFYYRIGFVLGKRHKKQKRNKTAEEYQRKPSRAVKILKQVEIDLNFLGSIIGSVLYLAGSVYFLPRYADRIITGDGLFIAGSAAIYISEAWKIFRMIRASCAFHHSDHRARLNNILSNLQAMFISFFAGLGGFFYFIGTILFLPKYVTTDFGENRAAALFLAGGIFFSLAGLLLQYRYFCPRRE